MNNPANERRYIFILPHHNSRGEEQLTFSVFGASEETARAALQGRLVEIGYDEETARHLATEAEMRAG